MKSDSEKNQNPSFKIKVQHQTNIHQKLKKFP